MAKLTLVAAVQVDGTHIITRSTDDAIGSNMACLIFDDTKTKYEIQQAVGALMRHLSREFLKSNLPAQLTQ